MATRQQVNFGELLDFAAKGVEMPVSLQQAIATAVTDLVHGKYNSLDQAFGLFSPHAGISRYRIKLRDEYLSQAFALMPGKSHTERARNLAQTIRRFEASTWKRWKHLEAPPDNATPLQQNLFLAFKIGGRLPSGWRRIYDVAA